VPDFIDVDGIEYTDIEVIVEMDGDIRDTVQLVKTLERPIGDGAQMKAAKRKASRGAKRARTQPGLDCVSRVLIEHGLPLTQRNWITFAYLGDKSSIDEPEGEELADLPEGFENWPEDELPVVK